MTLNSQPSVRVGFFAMFLNVVDLLNISVNILKAACQCHGVVDAADTSFVRLRRFFNFDFGKSHTCFKKYSTSYLHRTSYLKKNEDGLFLARTGQGLRPRPLRIHTRICT